MAATHNMSRAYEAASRDAKFISTIARLAKSRQELYRLSRVEGARRQSRGEATLAAESGIAARALGAAVALALIGALSPNAQAAELPSNAAAPAPSGLTVCNSGGMAGFLIPGSQTCLRLSGYVAEWISAGNLTPQYGLQFTGPPATATPVTLGVITPLSQRDSLGFAGHAQLAYDARTNTAFGPLRA